MTGVQMLARGARGEGPGVLPSLAGAKVWSPEGGTVWASPVRTSRLVEGYCPIGLESPDLDDERFNFSPLELPPCAMCELPDRGGVPAFPLGREELSPEPKLGVGEDASDKVEVVVVLPDRSRHRRRFSSDVLVEQLYTWACAEGADTDVAFFELVVVRGGKPLESRHITLREAGILRHTHLRVRRMCT